MNIDIKQHNVELPGSLIGNIHKYITAYLGRYSPVIRRVSVRIADINGPRGGEDKSCRIQVYLNRATSVIVEDRGVSIFDVLGRAVVRINMALSRSVDRVKCKRRKIRTFKNSYSLV